MTIELSVREGQWLTELAVLRGWTVPDLVRFGRHRLTVSAEERAWIYRRRPALRPRPVPSGFAWPADEGDQTDRSVG